MQSILLVGSSIFKAWTQAIDSFPNYKIVNRAVDGTTTSYWVETMHDVLVADSPDVILYYCGSNDLNCEIPEETILTNVRECRMIISNYSHSIKFAYFSIIKAPQKVGKWNVIDELNKNIMSSLYSDDMHVDSNAVFFHGGNPVKKWFIEDGLHLTSEAYDQLSRYAVPLIDKWLNK